LLGATQFKAVVSFRGGGGFFAFWGLPWLDGKIDDDPVADLEAMAAEHGGIWAALERPDLPDPATPTGASLEPMILRTEAHADEMVRYELLGLADGEVRFAFLVRGGRMVDVTRSPRPFDPEG